MAFALIPGFIGVLAIALIETNKSNKVGNFFPTCAVLLSQKFRSGQNGVCT